MAPYFFGLRHDQKSWSEIKVFPDGAYRAIMRNLYAAETQGRHSRTASMPQERSKKPVVRQTPTKHPVQKTYAWPKCGWNRLRWMPTSQTKTKNTSGTWTVWTPQKHGSFCNWKIPHVRNRKRATPLYRRGAYTGSEKIPLCATSTHQHKSAARMFAERGVLQDVSPAVVVTKHSNTNRRT